MAGWCGRTDVLGVGWLFECVLAAVFVVQCPPEERFSSGDGCSKREGERRQSRDICSRWHI